MSLNTNSPYSPQTQVPRSTQIALLIPLQGFEQHVTQVAPRFPAPAYPDISPDENVCESQTGWLSRAMVELEQIDVLVEADDLSPIKETTKAEAKRILAALNPQSLDPVIYPEDGEIVIHFKAPTAPASVGIEISNDGRGACYSHIDGRNRSAHYGVSRDIPDEFVRSRLRSLSSLK